MKLKDQRTTDVCTVFKKATDYVHLDTGKNIAGHYCLVCKYIFIPYLNVVCNITDMLARDNGASVRACFFSGSMSSLRTHISRYGVIFMYHSQHLSDPLKGASTTLKSTRPGALNLI